MNELDVNLDGTYVGAEQRAAAARRISREPDAELLLDVLGLAAERPQLKPYVIVNGISLCATCRMRVKADGVCRRPACTAGARNRGLSGPPAAPAAVRPGYCPLCNNPMPKTGVCRKRQICREAAGRKEMEAQ